MSDTPLQGRLATLFISRVIIIWKHLPSLFLLQDWFVSCSTYFNSLIKLIRLIDNNKYIKRIFKWWVMFFRLAHIIWARIDIFHCLISGKPVSWAFLNPSVSPFRSSSNGLIVESSNPAVRLYRYDSYTGKVSYSLINKTCAKI